ncbi:MULTISPECIES: AraC family transcriptional regulator [unclassified Pseudomonas]|uniref:helix-turn-helix transcriptional regulator n=1 Tax=unclassified Pseudomonas TaxID=196821 RepID=UPI002447BB61|nr:MULTISPECIES: AraC family transcriptional regulator [unclassified Pseudomonas]MDG9925119.1 AraC family transcriptional regulator [Pseudomonas sp. GD04045]MDH0037006.1 AraC family transcriptional regulator [Pseudomonas sp. GD04019]
MLEARGIDLELLQREWGMRLATLRQPHLRVPSFLARRFWEAARRLDGDEAIGLEIARLNDPGMLQGLAYLMQLMPDRLSAIERLLHFWPLASSHSASSAEIEGEVLRLRVWPSVALRPAVEEVDFWAARQVYHLKSFPGAPAALRELRLRRRPPADPSPWLRMAGAPVVFGADADELVLDLQALRAPRLPGSAAVCAALEEALLVYAEQTAEGGELEQVASAVLDSLPGEASLEQVAEHLHMTPRTLHRTLLREGWSFSSIIDEHRRLLAADLLRDEGLTSGEVADRLGYRELSSFNRAFRRWYGVTPAAFREGLPGQA